MKNFILKINISLTFLYLSISLALKGDLSNFRVAEYYISDWVMGEIFIRLFISLGFFCSINILFGSINKTTKTIMLIFLLLPIWDGILYFTNSSFFGLLFTFTNSTVELIPILIATIISSILLIKQTPIKKKNYIWIIFMVLGIGASFLKPLYIDDWESANIKVEKNTEEFNQLAKNHGLDISKSEPRLFAFFTTSCPYCKLSAIKMGINERNKRLPKTIVVFPSNKEEAENFLTENKLKNVDYLLVSDSTFIVHAGNSFPSIYYLKDNDIFHWVGGKFNFQALNMIGKQ